MHTLFLTPYFNQPRGNSTTTRRIVNLLQKEGIVASVIPYLENDNWHRPSADILHIIHATRFLKWAKKNEFIIDRPYLVTMGGTDINIDLMQDTNAEVFDFLDNASFITVFTEDAKEKVCILNSNWKDKTIVIPQSVWSPWRIAELIDELAPNILLPAGIRPVKDVLHVLPALDVLIKKYPKLTFTILGANLDQNVYNHVKEAEDERPWMHYAGVVPFEVMKSWYEKYQIIINTSISEGQSLALMEAMAIGRPVIARKNAANMDLIKHQQTGWLYDDMNDFIDAVSSIIENPFLRKSVIQDAKQWISTNYPPIKEGCTYLDLYSQLCNKKLSNSEIILQ